MTITKAIFLAIILVLKVNYAAAAPTAMIAIDVDTNEVLLENNANVRLHPAGLTKLMTLYVALQAIERAVSEELSCRLGSRRLASPDDKTQPLSLFQNITRDHPPGGDDVCPVPIVAAECGGFVARTGH